MDLYRIIDTLIAERNRIDRLIQSLDANARAGKSRARNGERDPRSKPGRKSIDVRGRRDISERMKRYWSRRREQESADAAEGNKAAPLPQVHGVASGTKAS